MTKTIYWDSCMFYEVLCDEEVSPQKKAGVDEILQDNKRATNVICTSVITHVECIPSKIDAKKPGARQRYEEIFDGVHFVDIEISRNILKLSQEIRDFYFKPRNPAKNFFGKVMDTGDAIHLATAIIYGADEFHTRDDNDRHIKVPLVSIYAYSGLNKICGNYPLNIISPESPQGKLNLVADSKLK